MIAIEPDLFIGTDEDYEHLADSDRNWNIIHAARDPWYIQAVGSHSGDSADDPFQGFVAWHGNEIMLNLIDGQDPGGIPKRAIDVAVAFIFESRADGKPVLVHCNYGASRSPTIVFLYLLKHTGRLPVTSLTEARRVFLRMYPPYNPNRGLQLFVEQHWKEYASHGRRG